MAISSSLCSINQPLRSISLPSREHPSSLKIEATLKHLKSCQISLDSSLPSATADTIQTALVTLAELLTSLEEQHYCLKTPSNQIALLTNNKEKELLEEALDESITLLDTCNFARDILVTMKQHVQNLQSALRRKGGNSNKIETTIHAYFFYRKKVKKVILKQLEVLKRIERKITSPDPLVKYTNSQHIIVLREEASKITISVFVSLLKLLCVPIALKTKASGYWALISKLGLKRLSSFDKKEVKMVHLVGSVDVALSSIIGNKENCDSNKVEVQMKQRMLETLDLSIEGLVGALNCLFRCLVQTRVSLLNTLS